MKKILIIVLVMLSAANISASDHLKKEQVWKHKYKLSKSDIHFGTTVNTLYKISDVKNTESKVKWEFKIYSTTAGIFKVKKDIRTESSHFIKQNSDIFPDTYLFIREKKDSLEKYETKISFDESMKSTTIFSHNNETKEIVHPIIKGVQDRLSVQLDYKNKMRTADFDQKYKVIDKGRMRDYSFNLVGTESIKTIFGQTSTVIIKKTIKDNKRSTLTWYAIDHDFIPVKIEQYRKDVLKFTVTLDEAT